MAELKQIGVRLLSTSPSWQPRLLRILRSASPNGRVALVGVGHPLRGDDYVGSYIAKSLIEQVCTHDVILFDVEDSIESMISKVVACDPRDVVVVDACEMNRRPGEVDLLPLAETHYPFFTTHGIPLRLLADKFLQKAETWILAIQPAQMGVTDRLSPEALTAAASVSSFIATALKEEESNG
jgi:hydrogenase 3 maturation protease